jgi:hypothetical protein
VTETRLRPYAPGDETQILALHRRVFHHTPNPASWRRQFLENPVAPAAIMLAERAGQIVGHQAHVPARMSYQGQEFLATRGVDTMVAPEARGEKLSLKLHTLALAEMSGRVDFHYSTPGAVPQHLFTSVDKTTVVGPTPPVELWLNPVYSLRGRPRWRPLTGTLRALGRAWVKLAPRPAVAGDGPPSVTLERFDARCDRLWAEAGARYGLTMLRDEGYLNWRYGGEGLTRLAVADDQRVYGWLVYRLWAIPGWRGAYLIDLVAGSAAVAERLLRAALQAFARRALDVVHAWAMPHAPDWPAMRRLGFRQRPSRINLVARPHHTCRLPLDVLTSWPAWHLTLADTDGV